MNHDSVLPTILELSPTEAAAGRDAGRAVPGPGAAGTASGRLCDPDPCAAIEVDDPDIRAVPAAVGHSALLAGDVVVARRNSPRLHVADVQPSRLRNSHSTAEPPPRVRLVCGCAEAAHTRLHVAAAGIFLAEARR